MKNILLLILCAVLAYSCSKDEEIYPATKSPLANFQTFRLVSETGVNAAANVSIDTIKRTVTITPVSGVSLNRLFPTATISEGAIVQPALGVYNDFSKPVEYTVVAGNRQVRKVWTVTVAQ
ncbi:DUF5018 domain-containing protein [Desertivirga xinjiangensis]|uniref:DUF5018 domain-containing protein n=1 Tax=Desertivirga xinjiangensis TaxID=539206 RepID=UPI00210C8D4F|nr:DUF5018 domain-containing protein [Pedobacter xinjiangensis]